MSGSNREGESEDTGQRAYNKENEVPAEEGRHELQEE